MKRVFLLLLFVFAFATLSFAGKVYGSITEGGKPIPKDLKIEVSCGTNNYAATTDAAGAFSVFVTDKGKCSLKLSYQNQTPSIDINSFENSVQYDLILEKQGAQYTLKRK